MIRQRRCRSRQRRGSRAGSARFGPFPCAVGVSAGPKKSFDLFLPAQVGRLRFAPVASELFEPRLVNRTRDVRADRVTVRADEVALRDLRQHLRLGPCPHIRNPAYLSRRVTVVPLHDARGKPAAAVSARRVFQLCVELAKDFAALEFLSDTPCFTRAGRSVASVAHRAKCPVAFPGLRSFPALDAQPANCRRFWFAVKPLAHSGSLQGKGPTLSSRPLAPIEITGIVGVRGSRSTGRRPSRQPTFPDCPTSGHCPESERPASEHRPEVGR